MREVPERGSRVFGVLVAALVLLCAAKLVDRLMRRYEIAERIAAELIDATGQREELARFGERAAGDVLRGAWTGSDPASQSRAEIRLRAAFPGPGAQRTVRACLAGWIKRSEGQALLDRLAGSPLSSIPTGAPGARPADAPPLSAAQSRLFDELVASDTWLKDLSWMRRSLRDAVAAGCWAGSGGLAPGSEADRLERMAEGAFRRATEDRVAKLSDAQAEEARRLVESPEYRAYLTGSSRCVRAYWQEGLKSACAR